MRETTHGWVCAEAAKAVSIIPSLLNPKVEIHIANVRLFRDIRGARKVLVRTLICSMIADGLIIPQPALASRAMLGDTHIRVHLRSLSVITRTVSCTPVEVSSTRTLLLPTLCHPLAVKIGIGARKNSYVAADLAQSTITSCTAVGNTRIRRGTKIFLVEVAVATPQTLHHALGTGAGFLRTS